MRHLPYPDLSVRPQIVRNAPLLTFVMAGSHPELKERVPHPLEMHPNGQIILNMWLLDEAQETTGFGGQGPVGITYLAAEVSGDEGATTDGTAHFPARYWLEHWGSSPYVREYAYEASGLRIEPGEISMILQDDVVEAALLLGGHPVVRARVRVGGKKLRTTSGYSIYYAQREAVEGGFQVARFEVPWISDAYEALDPHVELSFSSQASALSVVSNGCPEIKSVSFRRMTLVPYLAHHVVAINEGSAKFTSLTDEGAQH